MGVYEDEAGGWLSAFAPVRTADGEVVAMVQVDECFDVFRARAIATMVKSIWWNVGFLLVAVGALAYYLAGVMRRERAQQRALGHAVERQRALADELSAKQAQLTTQAKALALSNRDLTDFANVASHDLKSPLRGISNFAQLLARRNRATPGHVLQRVPRLHHLERPARHRTRERPPRVRHPPIRLPPKPNAWPWTK